MRQIAHRIAVMYRGDLVDLFDVAELDAPGPAIPTPSALLDAVPAPAIGRLTFGGHDDGPAATSIHALDEKACLDFLAGMVATQELLARPTGERAARALHGRAQMKAIGLEAELQPVEGERVNAIGRWRGTGGGKSLLFNGHLDTNPVTEGWTVDPWGGLVDDKFIYGIGVSNMKAGDAASFCAVKTLIDAGVRLKGDVILTYRRRRAAGRRRHARRDPQRRPRRLLRQQRADRPRRR